MNDVIKLLNQNIEQLNLSKQILIQLCGYFEEIKNELSECGFKSWTESQKYMVLSEQNTIISNPEVVVRKISEWKEEYGGIILKQLRKLGMAVYVLDSPEQIGGILDGIQTT